MYFLFWQETVIRPCSVPCLHACYFTRKGLFPMYIHNEWDRLQCIVANGCLFICQLTSSFFLVTAIKLFSTFWAILIKKIFTYLHLADRNEILFAEHHDRYYIFFCYNASTIFRFYQTFFWFCCVLQWLNYFYYNDSSIFSLYNDSAIFRSHQIFLRFRYATVPRLFFLQRLSFFVTATQSFLILLVIFWDFIACYSDLAIFY
jgi:hypothetical protein